MIVVADTSPLNYLVQLEIINLLTDLYESIFLPDEVLRELSDAAAPESVRQWSRDLPPWVIVRNSPASTIPAIANLDPGERAAICLAIDLRAELLLVDELRARKVLQQELGLAVTGTLGVLREAHRAKRIDGAEQFERLCSQTSFRHTPKLKALFLASLQR